MKYPTNSREMYAACKRVAYIKIEILDILSHKNNKTLVFEPLDISFSSDVAHAIAIPFVARMCELHPEWKGLRLSAHTMVGDACYSELRDVTIPHGWRKL